MFLTVLILTSLLNYFQADAFINDTYPVGEEINEEFAQLPSSKSCAGMSVQKCQIYKPRELKECKICGLVNTGRTYLVTGGKPLQPAYKYPWMVKVLSQASSDDNPSRCGGAIISENYILTAAHCIMNADKITVAFLTETDNVTPGYAVEKGIPHPNYDESSDLYDVALLKLMKKINCNIYRNPICLPPAKFYPKENTLFKYTGWGATCGNPPESEPPKLLEGQARLVSDSECNKTFNNIAYCFRGVHNHAACKGDSGGSMFFRCNGTFYTMGVASYFTPDESGNECEVCAHDNPFVFASIPKVIPWIIKTINMSGIK